MIIKDSTLKIGGNRFKIWIGKKLQKTVNRLMEKGNGKIISNPSCRFINPFTMLINFTLDNIDKYQLVIEGDYKKRYKESEDNIPDVTENELFDMIYHGQDKWFKKI